MGFIIGGPGVARNQKTQRQQEASVRAQIPPVEARLAVLKNALAVLVGRARAAAEELLNGYGQTLLRALREVEDALVQEDRQRELLERQREQLALARDTLEQARSRYLRGWSEYLPVLTALQTTQILERSELTAHRQLLSCRIQLHRALGGDWTRRLNPPGISKAENPNAK